MSSGLNKKQIDRYIDIYRNGLFNDTLPFWLENCVDRQCGGFTFSLDRDGTVLCRDKYIWTHARFVWLLSTLYTRRQSNPQWLELAEHGVDFILKHGFAQNGKMYFSVDRKGNPLRMRRYVFSEAFTAMALAAYSKATGDEKYYDRALEMFQQIIYYHTYPGTLEPKFDTETRPMKGMAMLMIIIAAAQVLRENNDDPLYTEWIDRCINEIESDFMKPQFRAVLETTTPEGELIDSFEGRALIPGHAIEVAWFILHEASLRNNDARLQRIGLTILDWMWEFGWDKKYGGLVYYTDVRGLPSSEYCHDMKLWWPHNETIIATLLAYHLTADDKYLQMHSQVHEWAYDHFPDPKHGEWFGYLHRDGSVSTELKGNQWKGPYHLPRMQLYCLELLERMKGDSTIKPSAAINKPTSKSKAI